MGLDDGHPGLMNTTIDLEFADGEYTFALPLAQIDELQRKTGAGIGELFARVVKGASQIGEEVILAPGSAQFYAHDLIETVRQGLIGGKKGMVDGIEVKVSPALANKLIATYVLNEPLVKAWELAVSILGACIMGYSPPGESGPPNEAGSQTDVSTTA